MIFSGIPFLYYFLPLFLIGYYATYKKSKNIFLFISGLIFYSWGEPVYILVMLFSVLADYAAGILMDRFNDRRKLRKLVFIVAILINIVLLSAFKYSSFIVTNINHVFGTGFAEPELPLPIGISFYTLQSISYIIDLYMRNAKTQRNFLKLAVFVTLFPKVIAGPIVRYADIEKELDERHITLDMMSDGVGLFIKGLVKKVLLADSIGMLWTEVKGMDYGEISVLTAWLGILAFTFQIYFDFSGYSDMAVGLGRMLGFHLPENFRHPYLSSSISEFWKRWHITLGTWFRRYIYFPLGGSRKGKCRTSLNLLIVWLLTGIWHGASWNFVLWGIYFGILIVLEKLFMGEILKFLPTAVSTVYTFFMVVLGWVLFDTNSITDAGKYLAAMFGKNGMPFMDSAAVYQLSSYFIIFIICVFVSSDLFRVLVSGLRSWKLTSRAMVVLKPVFQAGVMLLCTAYLVNGEYSPFLYFRF